MYINYFRKINKFIHILIFKYIYYTVIPSLYFVIILNDGFPIQS